MIKGKVSQWNDEKGFGFIEVEGHKTRVFFHVSSLKNRQHRPVAGELVAFTAVKDQQGRLKANSVALLAEMTGGGNVVRKTAPATQARQRQQQTRRIKIEPPKKNLLDALGWLLLLLSAGYAGYGYYQGQEPAALWPVLVPLAIALILLNIPKRPQQSHFSCGKCHKVEGFSARTLGAWRRGMTRLYCRACHQQWLQEQPKNLPATAGRVSGSGCAGSFLMLLALPVLAGYALFELFV